MEDIYFIMQRAESNKFETLGEWYLQGKPERICYNIEDEYRDLDKKVMGETRIPAGTYEIRYRKEGSFHEKYSKKEDLKKMGYIHKGMLEICDIPNFKYVLVHIGNTEKDTAGCQLTNTSYIKHEGRITGTGSTSAYVDFYMNHVTPYLDKGHRVFVKIIDEPLNKRLN